MKVLSRVWMMLFLLAMTAQAGEFRVVDPATCGLDVEKLAEIDPAVQRHVDDGQLVGAAGLVMRGDKIVYARTWGQRDREQKLPMTDDTIFRIYSMSKPITSVAAMILVERNKLALDDPVAKHLPEFAEMSVLVETKGEDGRTTHEEVAAKRPMTVRDLLRHTSGLTYGFFGNSEVDQRYRKAGVLTTDETLEQTVTKLSKIPLKHQPATRWHYSVSTDVLGRVVEVASGMTLDRFLEKRIFEPLGMKDTFFTVPKPKLSRFAQMYSPDGNGGLAVSAPARSWRFVTASNRFYSGGGGLCSTTGDYLRFCRMLLGEGQLDGERILQPQTVRLMHRNHLGDGIQRSGGFQFGLGFAIDPEGVYSWGGAAGTKFWIDPANDLITIYMVQISPTGRFDFSGELKNRVYAAIE
ncbi:MAG: serine hydrolase domain-containing protein [Thermoguttaceae bacterium]